MTIAPNENERAIIEPLVERYQNDIDGKRLVFHFWNSLQGYIDESPEIKQYIHSLRWRLKSPEHLADKLLRKLRQATAEKPFDITCENLFTKITDLGGIRILHLHTRQFAEINRCLNDIIQEQKIELLEGPVARTWDDEYRAIFNAIGVKTQSSQRMYTSVHYVVASRSATTVTCEIQVRTLMEEVWGEVDHSFNYPHETESIACREQIRALARVTSSATRLVDAVYTTLADIEDKKSKGT